MLLPYTYLLGLAVTSLWLKMADCPSLLFPTFHTAAQVRAVRRPLRPRCGRGRRRIARRSRGTLRTAVRAAVQRARPACGRTGGGGGGVDAAVRGECPQGAGCFRVVCRVEDALVFAHSVVQMRVGGCAHARLTLAEAWMTLSSASMQSPLQAHGTAQPSHPAILWGGAALHCTNLLIY